jgi:GDP-L-fucose synthase
MTRERYVPFDWRTQRILITGGTGFLGRHLAAQLQALGARPHVAGSADADLTDAGQVGTLFQRQGPLDLVYHLAARVGGIDANRRHGADFYRDNVLMDTHVVEACAAFGVGKLIMTGSNCSYPRQAPVPFREADFWNGYPEATNAPYGLAKRGLLAHFQAARRQHGLRGAYLILGNLYGPGSTRDTHVLPMMLQKFREAQATGEPVELWGTGKASRDFLFVADAAEALIAAAERYDGPEPVNIGSGEEVTIARLAGLVAQALGYTGGVVWDTARPDGHPRRCLDTTRAREWLGWTARTQLADGLRALCADEVPA